MLYQLSYWPKHMGKWEIGTLPSTISNTSPRTRYFDSLCPVCLRQNRQNLLNASRSELFFRFFVVL